MGKVAVITGGGGYIGGETAFKISQNGVSIAVWDINEETVNKTVERILANGGNAKGYIVDVTNPEEVNKTMNTVKEEMGSIDIMVHVAGGSARIAGPKAKYVRLTEQEDYVIDKVIKINLYGAIYCSRAAARIMRDQGTGGRIINFSSVVGTNGLGGCSEYAAAKAGVVGLVKSLAKEVGEYGITVNAVSPGIVKRPEEQNIEHALKTNFLNEKCTAQDVAGLVNFLASDEGRFITGQNYIIDGGRCLAMKGSD